MLSADEKSRVRRASLGLGLRLGLLIGLALALGTWGLQAALLCTVPLRLLYPPLILGALALLLLGGLGGALAAWAGSTLAGGLIWTAAAVLMSVVISHVPYDGHNLVVWLADKRFWGLPILPFGESAQVRVWLSGFFIVLLLSILGLLQDYRMEGLVAEVNPRGRLSARGWFLLALPLPLVLAVGLIADDIVNSPLRAGPRMVNEAIRTGRTYSGDLFELSLQSGVNYNAIAGLREHMSEDYTLSIGEADLGVAATVFVVVHFDNDFWINCRVVSGNLSHCYDASPPYLQGFPTLLASGEMPEDCPACVFRATDALRAWLATRGANFRGAPQVTRLAQWGGYVLMQASNPAGDYALECRFRGISPVYLEDCWEAEGSQAAAGAGRTFPGKAEEPVDAVTPTARPSPTPLPTPTEERSREAPADTGANTADAVVLVPTAGSSPAALPTAAEEPSGEAPADTAANPADAVVLVPTARPSPAPAAAPPDEASAVSSPDLHVIAMRPDFVGDLAAVGPVSRYRIEVTLDAPHGTEQPILRGQETVRYVNSTPAFQDVVYFRLFPNLPGYGGKMTVGSVQVGEQIVQGSLEAQNTALRVPLPDPLPPGGEIIITLSFDATVPTSIVDGYGQFVFDQDVMALANFFPLIPAYDEENCARFGNCNGGWNIEVAVPYGDAVFSPTALFEVSVTAPSGWTVAASGSTVAKKAGQGETDAVTWHIVSGPMRDFTLVMSPRFEVATQEVGDIVVNSYYLPEDRLGGKRVLHWAVGALDFFNEQFGAYPFAELDVVATPTIAGGIEYPGLIVLPVQNYAETGGKFQWSTVHEVAHEWWYSLVGNDQLDEPWLDEALTQYSTALYFEFYEGWDAYVEEVFEPRYQKVAGTDADDSIALPVAAYTPSNYGPIVYAKAPLFFHALRQETGDEAFAAILRSFFDTYRYKIASGPDFLALAEAVSGQDLSELYQEWLMK